MRQVGLIFNHKKYKGIMIDSSLKPGGFQNWAEVPVSTKSDVLATKADLRFSASTSLLEKIQRVFNGLMFFIAGAKLFALSSTVAAAYAKLGTMIVTGIGAASFLQIPVVATTMAVASKMIVALAFIQVIRKVLAVAICHIVYPAVILSYLQSKEIDQQRWESFKGLARQQYECRRVTLNKSGINYDAFAIEHEKTKGNGQWAIVAGGNGWIGESTAKECAAQFKRLGLNVLYVNGPGVGRSSGFPTSYSIGAGQEAGLQFLEKVVQAKKILIYGTSLGAGAQAEAIKNHEFQKDISYMVWSDRSFDKLSNAASYIAKGLMFVVKPLFFLLGIELDGMAGAKSLEKLGITHLVTQHSQYANERGQLPLDDKKMDDEQSDHVIPNKASLYLGLKKAGLQDSKRVKCYGNVHISHNDPLPWDIKQLADADILTFLTQNS